MHYDSLYAVRPNNILWGEQPGRLVARVKEFLPGGKVIDAGCGDGKNALFLEQQGFSVVGIDLSGIALQGLHHRFRRAGLVPRGSYIGGDVTDGLVGWYDALVSYGFFHCLPSETRVEKHRALYRAIKPSGYVFFTCLTDEKPLPENHGTDGITLASLTEIDQLFRGWNFEHYERGTIREDHLPVIGEHEHSAVWIIVRR